MVSCEILENGEQALFYRYDGKVQLKNGPKRIWLIRSRLVRLKRFNAKQDEYLKIKYKDGSAEHRIGPCHEFLNTLLHSSISVEKCYCLDANQAIIVYRNEKDEFSRKVINGPGIFHIQSNEWLHKFQWHGPLTEHKTKYGPNNNFEILNFAPNQLYYNVEDVRTSDDALITIKLMIFYELNNIDKMLNETKDPIADLINFCSSDIIEFTVTRTYLSFIENCHQLNDLANYKKLIERSKVIGFDVTKVVFRGYYASPKLQALHNTAVQTRTELKLQHESEMQEHERIYLNLKNDMNRLTLEQSLEVQKLENSQKLEKLKNENELNLKLREFINKTEFDKEFQLKDLQALSDANALKYENLQKLKELNIDLTSYLLSSLDNPNKVVQIVKKTDKTDSDHSNIHFHD